MFTFLLYDVAYAMWYHVPSHTAFNGRAVIMRQAGEVAEF